MAVNLSAIRDLLLPGLRKVTGEYKDIDRLYDKIFDVGSSRMQVERTASMRYLGLAAIKADGGATYMDNNAGEAYVYNQIHKGVGIGYSITRNAIDDNLYKAQFRPSNLGLQKSMNQFKEIQGANVLNLSGTYDPTIGGDGVSLLNTAHPLPAGGTFANRPAIDVDLNEASLLAGQTAIRKNFRDNAGLRMRARASMLIVPLALEPIAIRLCKTELRPGTADNDVNAILSNSGGLPKGYLAHDYLTSDYSWFLKTDIPGLQYLQRIPFETDIDSDFSTDNLLVKAFERFSFSYYDPRALYGSLATS